MGNLSVNIKFSHFGKHYSGHRLGEKKVVIDFFNNNNDWVIYCFRGICSFPSLGYLSANFLTIVMYLLIWFILSVFGEGDCIFRVIFFFFFF